MKFDALAPEYAKLWTSMYVHSKWQPAVENTAQKILANKARYAAVAAMTNVPWHVIGIIHQMEAGCNFGCHLHNGDPLAKRTRQVPKGRPLAGDGPFTWEASACDALLMKKLETVKDWSVERICYELERYNGWGYRKYHPTTLSPYLWSGTAHYARGKYVADGKWDSSAVSGQTGAMPLLKKLSELDTSVLAAATVPVVSEPPAPVETTPETSKKATEIRVPWWLKALQWLGLGGVVSEGTGAGEAVRSSIPAPPTEVLSTMAAWQGATQQTAGFLASPLFLYAIGFAVLYFVLCHVLPRWVKS